MENLNAPQALAMPFANNGKKNVIPVAPTGDNKASLTDGFPEITSEPTTEGGVPPARADFNGVMNLNSQFYFAFQNGWWPTFNKEVSDAIGGYPLNAVLWKVDSNNNTIKAYRSLITNNTYDFTTNPEYIGQYWAEVISDGQGAPIGMVYYSQSKEKSDNVGALPLFAGETINNFSKNYPVFFKYIKKHPELCKTQEEYTQIYLTNKGECPYYVFNEAADTLVLPSLKNYIKFANTAEGIKFQGAGLPNLLGQGGNNWHQNAHYGTAYPISGVFKPSGVGSIKASSNGGGDYYPFGVDFDASKGGTDPIYGKSDTVTPAHTTLYPWVVAYHAEQPDASQQVNEILEAGNEQVNAVKTEGTTQADNLSTQGAAIISQAQKAADEAEEWSRQSRGLAIGTVYYSQFSSAVQNPGALPLFTGETIASANTIYPDFYALISSNAELQCTSAEYETALSTYGECPKYVLNNGSMRLPLLKNYIKAANTNDGITQLEAGLQNITGFFDTGAEYYAANQEEGGAFTAEAVNKRRNENAKDVNERRINFNASLSNSIYGKSSTVSPASTTLYPWVYAFNKAVEASVAQAAEFQKALSSKADTTLANVASNIDYVVESYSDDNGNWYRKYKSGWVEQGGITEKVSASGQQSFKVTLLKPMKDTNYLLLGNYIYSAGQSGTLVNSHKTDGTSVYFTVDSFASGSRSGYVIWYVSGQGE